MRKLSDLNRFDHSKIEFGIPEDIPESNLERIPVIVDGVLYPYTSIELNQDVREIDGIELYRVDIRLKEELRHRGLGYRIYKKYIELMGNIISIKAYRHNENEIPKIYSKLMNEDYITVKKAGENFLACTDEWKSKHNIDEINLGEIEI